MKQKNYSFNSPDKNKNSNNALIKDDKFISLINNLSEIIKEYYNISKANFEEINNLFSENIDINNNNNIIPQLYYNIENQKNNLNYFIEKAKDLFKKMKIYKNNKKLGTTTSTNKDKTNSNNLSNVIKINDNNSLNKKNKINTNNKNIIELKITSKFRTEDDNNNKIINNTYNAYNTNIYNKSEKKYPNSIYTNLENIKTLIQNLSLYEKIISKVSLKSNDNFKKLQNDINILIDKCIKDKGRNSLRNNQSFYNEINNAYEGNNYSFNYNNISAGINSEFLKKNLYDEYYDDKNNKIKELKRKNDLYKNKVKDMEFEVEDLKSTIETLECTLNDTNNQINNMKIKNGNYYNNNISINNNEINKLKKKIKNYENNINNLKIELKGKQNDLELKDIKLNNALKEIEKMNELNEKQKEENDNKNKNNENEIINLNQQIKKI